MRARKLGGLSCLRNSVIRKHLFYNARKELSLDEIIEFENGRCIGKHWEVSHLGISDNRNRLDRVLVISTEIYARAWDAVKDEDFELRRRRR